MKISTLVENTTVSDRFDSEHGLSIYVETKKHKLLFDLGASHLFAENAEKMGIDLTEVDSVVISHGHRDHGGGLKKFLELNDRANIYVNHHAFEKHFNKKKNGEKTSIGLDEHLSHDDRLIYVGDHLAIDEELEIFSNVKGARLSPSGNQNLFIKRDEGLVNDDFSHEQNLVIRENGLSLLLAGCAHNGIVNILDHYKSMNETYPEYVIGGYHLYSRSSQKSEKPETVREIGEYFKQTGSKYYTCHCTGMESYERLKDMMADKIGYLSTGSQLTINHP